MEHQKIQKWVSDQQLHFYNNYTEDYYVIIEQHSACLTNNLDTAINYAQYILFLNFENTDLQKLELSAEDFEFLSSDFKELDDKIDYSALTDGRHKRVSIGYELDHLEITGLVRKFRIGKILEELPE